MTSIIVFYDNYCPNCKRFSKIIEQLDWFNLIVFKELRNSNHTDVFNDFDIEKAKNKMASYIHYKWHYGYESIFLIFKKIPLFWGILPLLYLLIITKIGYFFYNELAVKRKIIPLNCESNNCSVVKEN